MSFSLYLSHCKPSQTGAPHFLLIKDKLDSWDKVSASQELITFQFGTGFDLTSNFTDVDAIFSYLLNFHISKDGDTP